MKQSLWSSVLTNGPPFKQLWLNVTFCRDVLVFVIWIAITAKYSRDYVTSRYRSQVTDLTPKQKAILRTYVHIPANTIHWTNVGLMLVQRRRRWTNVKPALARSIVLTGMVSTFLSNVQYFSFRLQFYRLYIKSITTLKYNNFELNLQRKH